ncbi:uncharacterized protein BDR25DRAFT_306601 [Lindgomyces ingoldianus]|uniref:Uncharacterized protein n=1 Tax=Lindgomyces ingoldianus TaxID=673940 RepID=A0ACB6QEX5_9PLEO|nr:uncharacterized protein BDR25DRAFT_306601 [Lindgomyces ingoldianus]KAF2465452.1 hypothetical protein BDR25DRAFT_306601 [Lindgomyces ingoldianus]
MIKQVLTLCALVTLAQSKAIITNLCTHPVYIWSVPEVYGAADNYAVQPGHIYEEVFRYGTEANPGIAIKVTDRLNGIHAGKGEIDFQYTVDKYDPKKVWINLATVRGNAFGGNMALWTCFGAYKSPNVPTRLCSTDDNIELVLCGSERTLQPHSFAPADDYCSGHWVGRGQTRRCIPHTVTPKRTGPKKKEREVRAAQACAEIRTRNVTSPAVKPARAHRMSSDDSSSSDEGF